MITLRKLERLPERLRGRKLISLLAEPGEPIYIAGLVRLALALLGETALSEAVGEVPASSVPPLDERDRKLLRQRLAGYLGLETADWDLQAPGDRSGPSRRFPFAVWLDDLRSPFNVGSIIRTAEAYGFESVFSSPFTPNLDHPRTRRSAMGAEAYLSFESLSLRQMKARWGHRPVFALELGGKSLESFEFPGEGLALVGGEELGLSPEALAWADQSFGRVSLPLFGRKASLNVGVAFGILAAAWTNRVNDVARTEG